MFVLLICEQKLQVCLSLAYWLSGINSPECLYQICSLYSWTWSSVQNNTKRRGDFLLWFCSKWLGNVLLPQACEVLWTLPNETLIVVLLVIFKELDVPFRLIIFWYNPKWTFSPKAKVQFCLLNIWNLKLSRWREVPKSEKFFTFTC